MNLVQQDGRCQAELVHLRSGDRDEERLVPVVAHRMPVGAGPDRRLTLLDRVFDVVDRDDQAAPEDEADVDSFVRQRVLEPGVR
jgi:hypothetical protein